MADLDGIDATYINRKNSVRQKLMQDLRKRFRDEYLSQLLQEKSTVTDRPIEVGEIVFVADYDKKNVNWPLARVVAIHPGKDSEVRVATVKTSKGTLVRPVKGLVPLEIRSSEVSRSVEDVQGEEIVTVVNEDTDTEPRQTDIRKTRSGRQVKVPSRFGY